MMISITTGPSMQDPTDQVPIIVLQTGGRPITLTARTWSSRLGVYLVRRYVRQIMEGK